MRDLKLEKAKFIKSAEESLALKDMESYQISMEAINRAIAAEEKLEDYKASTEFIHNQMRKAEDLWRENNPGNDLVSSDMTKCFFWTADEIIRLRTKVATLTEENKILKTTVLNNSNVVVNVPPFPETEAIKALQEQNLTLKKDIHRLRHPELYSGIAAQLMLRAEEEAVRQTNRLATLTEENDIQRQAIQNLSTQVAGLRDCLLSFPFKSHNPKCGCPECEWLDKREKLLSQPDPGEKIMAVVEAVKYALAQEIRLEGRLVIDWTGVSILKQALASLEGGDTP